MTTQNLSYIPQLPTELLQFTQNDLFLLLDPEKPAWAVVNPTGMEIVGLCDGMRNIQTIAGLLAKKYQLSEEMMCQDVLGYIHHLASSGLLCSEADEPAEKDQMPTLKGIYLHVTNRCNLNCKHCYARGMGPGEDVPTRDTPHAHQANLNRGLSPVGAKCL